MSVLIDALPGLPMSVRKITDQVGRMWEELATAEGEYSDFRVSQMNVLLHFGAETTVEEAKQRFDQAIAFAQVYPCRIIILAERNDGEGASGELKGKLFSQCYLGKNFRDLCCCEALMLSYPRGVDELIAVQCSLWLETDLPVYYWPHRMDPQVLSQHFGSILSMARRLVFDRSIEGERSGALEALKCRKVQDFTYAKLLRIRQTMGQQISAFQPDELVGGLQAVRIEASEGFQAEAQVLIAWVGLALDGCFKIAKLKNEIVIESPRIEDSAGASIVLRFEYTDASKSLIWSYCNRTKVGEFKATYPSGTVVQPIHLEPVGEVQVIAEALFF